MKVEQAKKYFHGAEGYNCAQAVLAVFDVPADELAAAKANGGGRTPDGVCGAFHSARELVGEVAFAEMSEKMADAAGSLRCREIMSLKKLSCRDCVGLATELVQGNSHTL